MAAELKWTVKLLSAAVATVRSVVDKSYLTDCLWSKEIKYPVPDEYLLERSEDGKDMNIGECLAKSNERRENGTPLFHGIAFNITRAFGTIKINDLKQVNQAHGGQSNKITPKQTTL